jgi:hypothetical protein
LLAGFDTLTGGDTRERLNVAVNAKLPAEIAKHDRIASSGVAVPAESFDYSFDNRIFNGMDGRANVNANILPLVATASAKSLIPVRRPPAALCPEWIC